MTIEKIHREVNLRWDEISQSQYRELTDVEMDSYINFTIFHYVETFTTGRKTRPWVGFEINRPMIDRVSTLIVGYPEDEGITETSITNGIYEYELENLAFPFKSLLSAELKTTDCGDVPITIERTGHSNQVKNNTFRKPSKTWNQVPAFRRGDNRLYVSTDNLFTVEKLICRYIRKPAEVCIGTYTIEPTTDNPNPTVIKPKTECDLPEDYHSLLVDMVVQELTGFYKDIDRRNLLTEKLNNL
jgi:hypothetical protein